MKTIKQGDYSDLQITQMINRFEFIDLLFKKKIQIIQYKTFGSVLQQILKSRDLREEEIKKIFTEVMKLSFPIDVDIKKAVLKLVIKFS